MTGWMGWVGWLAELLPYVLHIIAQMEVVWKNFFWYLCLVWWYPLFKIDKAFFGVVRFEMNLCLNDLICKFQYLRRFTLTEKCKNKHTHSRGSDCIQREQKPRVFRETCLFASRKCTKRIKSCENSLVCWLLFMTLWLKMVTPL